MTYDWKYADEADQILLSQKDIIVSHGLVIEKLGEELSELHKRVTQLEAEVTTLQEARSPISGFTLAEKLDW